MALRIMAAVCVLASAAACGGKGGSPTGPSPATETRIMALEGNLNFGDVPLGSTAERNLRIWNQGNAALSITGLTGPGGFTASWTSGTIPPTNSFQDVTIRFTPTENRAYNGTLTVNGNQTSGANTLPITARGLRELFVRTGGGNAVFDMPTDVSRVRIFGRWNNRGTSNFIVRIGGRSVVNAILRDGNPYEGVHLVTGGVVEILSSENITEWRFTEER